MDLAARQLEVDGPTGSPPMFAFRPQHIINVSDVCVLVEVEQARRHGIARMAVACVAARILWVLLKGLNDTMGLDFEADDAVPLDHAPELVLVLGRPRLLAENPAQPESAPR